MNHITPANLGWWILAFLVTGTAVNAVQEWIRDRWELTPDASWRRPLMRRWYGTHAHVTLAAEAEADDPEVYVVLGWDEENTGIPSLKVCKLNPEYLTRWDEDSEAFWAPVTVFAPYTVRRFRPHFERFGRVFIPWLTLYLPLPLPAGFDHRTPAEINTDYYLDTTAGRTP